MGNPLPDPHPEPKALECVVYPLEYVKSSFNRAGQFLADRCVIHYGYSIFKRTNDLQCTLKFLFYFSVCRREGR
jgi:hypothetical protein